MIGVGGEGVIREEERGNVFWGKYTPLKPQGRVETEMSARAAWVKQSNRVKDGVKQAIDLGGRGRPETYTCR